VVAKDDHSQFVEPQGYRLSLDITSLIGTAFWGCASDRRGRLRWRVRPRGRS